MQKQLSTAYQATTVTVNGNPPSLPRNTYISTGLTNRPIQTRTPSTSVASSKKPCQKYIYISPARRQPTTLVALQNAFECVKTGHWSRERRPAYPLEFCQKCSTSAITTAASSSRSTETPPLTECSVQSWYIPMAKLCCRHQTRAQYETWDEVCNNHQSGAENSPIFYFFFSLCYFM